MAITVRLTFDVTVPTLDDTDEMAQLVGKTCAPLIVQSPQFPAPIAAGTVELVGVSRLSAGLMRGDVTTEAVEGQTWNRVDAMPEVS